MSSGTSSVMAGIPSGTILPWLGSIAQIPQGWLLCDGTNGSPNLNHKYLIGTTDPNELLSTIGQPNHSHGFVGVTGTYNGAHNDNVVQNNNAPLGVPGYDHTHNFAGQTDLQPNLPPSIYVFYIFKS